MRPTIDPAKAAELLRTIGQHVPQDHGPGHQAMDELWLRLVNRKVPSRKGKVKALGKSGDNLAQDGNLELAQDADAIRIIGKGLGKYKRRDVAMRLYNLATFKDMARVNATLDRLEKAGRINVGRDGINVVLTNAT